MLRSIDALLSYLLLLNHLLLLLLVLVLVLLALVVVLLALVLLGSSVARRPYDSTARTGRRSPTYYEGCRGSNTGVG